MPAELLIRIVELKKVSMQNENNRQTEKARPQQDGSNVTYAMTAHTMSHARKGDAMIEVAIHRNLALKGNIRRQQRKVFLLSLIALKLLDDIWPIGEKRCYHIQLYECVCVFKLCKPR